jgi:TonB family protein
MPNATSNVVQADNKFPNNALLLIYSSLPNLNFRSSVGGVNKQSYNSGASRYEVLIEPLKQMLFVQSPGFMEMKIATLNPMVKEVFIFKIENRITQQNQNKMGRLKVISEPVLCTVFLNGMQMAEKTEFEGVWPEGRINVRLEKENYFPLDTQTSILPDEISYLNLRLFPKKTANDLQSKNSASSEKRIELNKFVEANSSNLDTKPTFTVVEIMPQFPGGDGELMKFISNNLHYPQIARDNDITGTVYLTFVVDENGDVVETKVIRGAEKSLDAEAVRIVNSLPRWTLGRQSGKAVRTQFTFPVKFKLN